MVVALKAAMTLGSPGGITELIRLTGSLNVDYHHSFSFLLELRNLSN